MSPDPDSLLRALAEHFPSQNPAPLLERSDTDGFQIQVENKSQREAWQITNNIAVSNGFLSVVVDDKHMHLWQSIEDSHDWRAERAEILRKATEIDPASWFRDRRDPRKKIALYEKMVIERKKSDPKFNDTIFDWSVKHYREQWENYNFGTFIPPTQCGWTESRTCR